jgi:hypothetical protein
MKVLPVRAQIFSGGGSMKRFAFLFFVVSIFLFQGTAIASEVSPEAREFLNKMSNYLAEVTETTRPSVVNISTTSTVTMKENQFGDLFNDPFLKDSSAKIPDTRPCPKSINPRPSARGL